MHNYGRGWSRDLKRLSVGSKNGSNVKHICLSKNEKSWQTKQEKMIKAQNEARSHALNHSSEITVQVHKIRNGKKTEN